ncbi:MAG TPA: FecR family protein [Flavobacteriales bacterium]|nr:FecR family protein [Flavobacteriales bacterium]
MQLIPNHIDELIARNLANNASEQEQKSLHEWIDASPENAKYYKDLQFIFETSKHEQKNETVDANAAWNKIKPYMSEDTIRVVPMPVAKKQGFPVFLVAAGFALICIIALTVYYFMPAGKNQNELLSISTDDKSIEQKLGDGTVVTVNPNSHFVALHKNRREYKLSGNAYFDVKHDDKNPFIIHVNNLCIKDIGTSFSVEGDPKDDVIRVNVTEGEVQLYTLQQKGITIKAGESGEYYKSMDVFGKIQDIEDDHAQTFSMNFDNASLQEVVSMLEKQFETKIVFSNEKLKSCRISVKFEGSNLEEILEIVGETMDIWTTEENGVITLGGDGCNK